MKIKVIHSYLQNVMKKNEKKGFTLIELLVVIVITGILPAIAITSLLKHYDLCQRQISMSQYGFREFMTETIPFTYIKSG